MVEDVEGQPLQYEFDAVGNLIRTIDPAGNSIRIKYDDRNRKIETRGLMPVVNWHGPLLRSLMTARVTGC